MEARGRFCVVLSSAREVCVVCELAGQTLGDDLGCNSSSEYETLDWKPGELDVGGVCLAVWRVTRYGYEIGTWEKGMRSEPNDETTACVGVAVD